MTGQEKRVMKLGSEKKDEERKTKVKVLCQGPDGCADCSWDAWEGVLVHMHGIMQDRGRHIMEVRCPLISHPCLPHPPSCSPHSPTLLSPCSRLKRGLCGWRLRLLLSGPLTRHVVHSGGLQGLELLEVHVPADLWRDRDRRRRGQTGEGHVANESIFSFYCLSSTADPSIESFWLEVGIRAGHAVAAGGGRVEQTDWSRAAKRVTWHFVLLWLIQLPAVFLLLLVS